LALLLALWLLLLLQLLLMLLQQQLLRVVLQKLLLMLLMPGLNYHPDAVRLHGFSLRHDVSE